MTMRLKIVCLAAAVLLPGWAAVAQNDTLSTSHTVGKEQMNKGLVTSGLGALQGQAAGVTVSGANQSAMLSAVRVRGTTSLTGGNDPLVVIDGVMSDLATLSSLYPGDIESFTVLKDASETAPYGSRGASGVIQVLTTRGHGGDFSISYDGTAGAEAVYRNMEMLSADGFRTWNKNHGYPFRDDGFDSDMVSSILRTGFVQNHHIAFGGGSENSHYRASVGVLDHRAVIKKQNIQNYSVKLDVGQKAFGFLQLDLGLFGSLQNEDAIHDMQKLFYSAAAFNPTIRAGAEPDGSYVQIPTSSQINHPVSLLEKRTGPGPPPSRAGSPPSSGPEARPTAAPLRKANTAAILTLLMLTRTGRTSCPQTSWAKSKAAVPAASMPQPQAFPPTHMASMPSRQEQSGRGRVLALSGRGRTCCP